MMKSKSIKILAALLLCAAVLLSPLSVSSVSAELDTGAFEGEAVYVYEYNSEETVVAVNEHERMYPGSLTKIMTVLVAEEYLDSSDVITVTSAELRYVGYNSSTAGLAVDELVTYDNLVAGALLPSGNDAAIVLAITAGERILGEGDHSVQECYDAFIAAMNEKAQALGMTETHFANPDGYGDENNYSTAYDMVMMGKTAQKSDTITRTAAKMKVSITTNIKAHVWKSTNMMYYEDLSKFSYSLSGTNPYYDSRVTGMKTGYTDMGQKCFLFTAEEGEKSVIGVLMNVNDDDQTKVFSQAYGIITYILDDCETVALVTDDNRKTDHQVANRGLLETSNILSLYMQNDEIVLVESALTDGIRAEISLVDGVGEINEKGRLKLYRDIEPGEVVAYAAFVSGDTVIKTVPMISVNGYKRSTWKDYAVLLIIVIFVLLAIALIKRGVKRRKAIKRKKARLKIKK